MSSNGQGQKDTVYIDIDDEITAVIDKLRGSPHRIVALVLPKRAAVFQSVVNMKLLKRTAESSKKHVVLITSEAALLPLAGAVGLHVAHSLQSKPEIPPGPGEQPVSANVTEGEAPLDPNAPIGHLASQPQGDDESIQVDNSEDKPKKSADMGRAKKAKPDKGSGGKKKIKIPNFEKFRTRIILGSVALVVLIVGFVLAFMVLPKATITLRSDTSKLDTDLTFTADTQAKAFDKQNSLLPALSKEFRRTDTERVAATGQVDKGNKASGSIVLTNCSESTGSVTVPSGTGLSSGGLNFITTQSVNLPESSFTGGGTCKTDPKTVAVQAEKPGEQYNIASGKDFTVSGFSGVKATNNSAMSGGTSNIVKVISQADIDKGKQAIQDRANNTAPADLEEQLKDDGYYPLKDTLVAGDPTVTTDHNANAEVDSVTVTSTTVYTMLGVKEKDLVSLIEADTEDRIETDKQVIRNNGLGSARYNIQNRQDSQTTISLQTSVTVGPDLDSDGIKKEIAGKNREETEKALQSWPDITDVDVSYSPFWVTSTPKNTSKIILKFEDSK